MGTGSLQNSDQYVQHFGGNEASLGPRPRIIKFWRTRELCRGIPRTGRKLRPTWRIRDWISSVKKQSQALYDATPDAQRFLANIPLEWTSGLPTTVVTNWTEKLKERCGWPGGIPAPRHMVEIAHLRKPYTP